MQKQRLYRHTEICAQKGHQLENVGEYYGLVDTGITKECINLRKEFWRQ